MIRILSDLTYVQLAFGSLILLISLILRPKKHSKLNEPPLVPYKYPIIGHTFDYREDRKNFIEKCHAKYGEIFSLYLYGKVVTYVGKELTSEVFKNHKDFSFNDASDETIPWGGFLQRSSNFFDPIHKLVKVNLSGGLSLYSDRVQSQLVKSIDDIIGDYKTLKSPLASIELLIAKPIAAVFVGEELSDDKELLNSFAYITSEFVSFLSRPPILGFIHPKLNTQFLIARFRYLNNPFKAHRGLIREKIAPIIEKRLSEMKRLGDNYIPPVDLLQRYIELNYKDYTTDIDIIIDYIIVTIFASVHTTSYNLTLCLHEWVNNPQFQKEILEEQEQLYINNENPHYSIDQIVQLEKLDSFVKETLRFSLDSDSLPHKIRSSYFTFSNGFQVPKDRFVYIRTKEIHYDEQLQGQNPNEFNAFRYLNKNSPATRIEKNYLIFGLGKYACPGRFFAINEIKVALHFMFLKYNIRKVKDENIRYGGLIFEKRT